MKRASPHPLLWIVEPLQENPSYALRPMFGGRSVYYDGRMVLHLVMGDEPWRGVLVPAERESHASLRAEFPVLRPHTILGKWLYLPERESSFESIATRLVTLIRALDPRIGIVPSPKKVARAKSPSPRKTAPRKITARSKPRPKPAAIPKSKPRRARS